MWLAANGVQPTVQPTVFYLQTTNDVLPTDERTSSPVTPVLAKSWYYRYFLFLVFRLALSVFLARQQYYWHDVVVLAYLGRRYLS
jgi:hypothetical protein